MYRYYFNKETFIPKELYGRYGIVSAKFSKEQKKYCIGNLVDYAYGYIETERRLTLTEQKNISGSLYMLEVSLCPYCQKDYYYSQNNEMCENCLEREHDEQVQQSLLEGDTFATMMEKRVYCPHCGEMVMKEMDIESSGEIFNCPNCDEKFTVTVDIIKKYSTSKV